MPCMYACVCMCVKCVCPVPCVSARPCRLPPIKQSQTNAAASPVASRQLSSNSSPAATRSVTLPSITDRQSSTVRHLPAATSSPQRTDTPAAVPGHDGKEHKETQTTPGLAGAPSSVAPEGNNNERNQTTSGVTRPSTPSDDGDVALTGQRDEETQTTPGLTRPPSPAAASGWEDKQTQTSPVVSRSPSSIAPDGYKNERTQTTPGLTRSSSPDNDNDDDDDVPATGQEDQETHTPVATSGFSRSPSTAAK